MDRSLKTAGMTRVEQSRDGVDEVALPALPLALRRSTETSFGVLMANRTWPSPFR
jgi:hypothetical protein